MSAKVKFNRNILYCKLIYLLSYFSQYSYLIGTFCIVNLLPAVVNDSGISDLIGTFCIVNKGSRIQYNELYFI